MIDVKKMNNLEKSMSAFSNVMISRLMIVAVLLVLALLIMLGRWLFENEDDLMIFPFEVATGGCTYNKRAP